MEKTGSLSSISKFIIAAGILVFACVLFAFCGLVFLGIQSEQTVAPTPTIFPLASEAFEPTATISLEDIIKNELVDRLDSSIVRDVTLLDNELVVQTSLNRENLDWFFEDIGAIHSVLVRLNLDIDTVTLEDVTGQKIILSYDDMQLYYSGNIDYDTFRSTWTIINPQ